MSSAHRLLIDTHNIKGGGAKQVASSVLTELALAMDSTSSNILEPFGSIDVLTNRDVLRDVPPEAAAVLAATVQQPFPLDLALPPARTRYDVTWTVFGPRYTPAPSRTSVVGFADVTSIWPQPQGHTSISSSVRRRARGIVSRASHRRASHLIVESRATAIQLARRLGPKTPSISVVPNSLHSAFYAPDSWKPVTGLPTREPGTVYMCYPARGYPHKNHHALTPVVELLSRMGIRVHFLTTLDSKEVDFLRLTDHPQVTHLGSLDIQQMPTLIDFSDAVIFPSLLEAFSATPLEVLFMGKPLLASDRTFISDVVDDLAYYFEPTSVESIAQTVSQFVNLRDPLQTQRASRRDELQRFSPKARLEMTLQIVASVAASSGSATRASER